MIALLFGQDIYIDFLSLGIFSKGPVVTYLCRQMSSQPSLGEFVFHGLLVCPRRDVVLRRRI